MTSRVASISVIKRSGCRENFSIDKVARSVFLACKNAGLSQAYANSIIEQLLTEIASKKELSTKEIADRIERLMIEKLIENPKWEEAAKYYVLARIYQDVYGKDNWDGKFDSQDLELSYPALKVMEQRYILRDPQTLRYRETPQMVFQRVAKAIAEIERIYGASEGDVRNYEEKFYELLSTRRFLPNSPTLMNAGTRLGVLSACFVLPVRDSMTTPDGEGIMDAVRAMALIQQQGGGTGFNFSELRPEGDVVASTAGVASGPVSFMKLFDVVTEVIKQGGRRRGANMGILDSWHLDIEKFIKSKSGELKDVQLQNFNISIGAYDYFMKAVEESKPIPLINPRKTYLANGTPYDSRYYAIARARNYITEDWVAEEIIEELEANGGSIPLDRSKIITIDEAMVIAKKEDAIVKWIDAERIFEDIVKSAWDSGDPGMIFLDTINRRHPVWYLGKISSTNPCGEQPLLDWESCNLGSINLEKYVYYDRNNKPHIDWHRLANDIYTAVRFLDNVIDAAKWPLYHLERAAKRARKIGLGVMGWAHMLIKLGIPYDSVDAIYLAYYLAEWIEYCAIRASINLAKERNPFPTWDSKRYRPTWRSTKPVEELLKQAGITLKPSRRIKSILSERPSVDWSLVEEEITRYGLRNACVTSIAPTGTISIIAGTSSGIEPIFALAFVRRVTVGTFIEVNKLFLNYLRRYELDEPELIKIVAEEGTAATIPFLPRTIRKLFRTAHDIKPIWHVLHQASWQQFVDAGVSKTVNMRNEASVDEVRSVYLLAWKLGCKGITVYRDKSKAKQVIYFGVKAARKMTEKPKEIHERIVAEPKKFRLEIRESRIVDGFNDISCPTCEL